MLEALEFIADAQADAESGGGIAILCEGLRGQVRARVRGVVTSVVFRQDADDWSVLTVRAGKQRIRVTGHSAAQEGQEVSAEGVLIERRSGNGWKNEITQELRADRIIATTPRSAKGIAAFLAANVRGIGPVLAQRIAKTFGTDLFRVLESDADRLAEVKGVSPTILEAVRQTWQEQRSVADIMLFLHDQSLSPALCRRIYLAYGDRARQCIQENPYRLALDVRGIGFLKTDQIAAKLGVPRRSPYRIQAGLLHALKEASAAGHCGLRRQDLIEKVVEWLAVDEQAVQQSLRHMLEAPQPAAIEHKGCIWLAWLFEAQREIAQRLRKALERRPAWLQRLGDLQQAIEEAQGRAGIALAPAQQEAVRMALQSSVCVITGGPGCGKTTTLNVVLDIMRRHKITFHLAAPTGKAAQRASQATGAQASTLHRLLKIGPDGPGRQVQSDALIIDEASMMDVPMMRDVLRGIGRQTALIIVGDVDQLPSVGPGAVLADLISSGRIPCVRLSVVYRQGNGSLIIEAAHAVNRGELPRAQRPDGDFFFLSEKRLPALASALRQQQESGESAHIGRAAQQQLLDLVCHRLPARYGLDPIADIMVLSPMNNGHCGVKALNPALQAALNPQPDARVYRFGDNRFGVGDKVIQTRNNYDLGVFNGDTGRIVECDHEKKQLLIDYDGRIIEHPFEDADELRLAYCITVHKSQGSQAPCVIIPVLTEHFAMLQRNLIYTGITRAQKLCILLGTEKALAIAVKRTQSLQRLTLLRAFLEQDEASSGQRPVAI